MNENPLKKLTKHIEALKKFSYEHSNTIECLFLIAYSIEQALLVILTFAYQQHIGLIIPLFVIIAFFTFGIQKLFMESKNAYLEKVVLGLNYDNESLTVDMANLMQQNSLLSKQLEQLDKDNKRLYKLTKAKPKGLNKNKAIKNIRSKNDRS